MPCEHPKVAAPACLADYTRTELIVPKLRGSDPAEIIEELGHELRAHEVIGDVLSFYHAALNHEFLSNSATPYGIAIPHARSAQVTQLTFALGRTQQPIIWGPRGSWRVDCVFLIAVPSTDASEYLSLLSSIASFGRRLDLLACLRAAPSPERMAGVLKTVSAKPR